jgi:hypothetical protein
MMYRDNLRVHQWMEGEENGAYMHNEMPGRSKNYAKNQYPTV